ncbi:hypothetical protein ACWDTI_15105 [Gordonia sp. NPDC003424]
MLILQRVMPWRAQSDDGGFAPTAYRPVGSGGAGQPTMPESADRNHPALAGALRASGLALGCYLIGVATLRLSGAATDTASVAVWSVRSIVMTQVALVALAVSIAIPVRTRSDGRSHVAVALMVGGLVVVAGMEFDIRLLHLYHIESAGLGVAIHAAPIGAVLVGAALAVRHSRSYGGPVAA